MGRRDGTIVGSGDGRSLGEGVGTIVGNGDGRGEGRNVGSGVKSANSAGMKSVRIAFASLPAQQV